MSIMSASIEIKKCCLTCRSANRKNLHPYAASFQVMCEHPTSPEGNKVHLARDFCYDKYYSPISFQDLLKDLKLILEIHYDKFDYAIEAIEALIEGKPYSTGGHKIENIPEYTLAELEDIKNGFGRSLGLLQFFLAECLPAQHPSSGSEPVENQESDSSLKLSGPKFLAGG